MQIHDQILKNYALFDDFLSYLKPNSFESKAYLSIRLSYSALYGKKSKITFFESCKDLLKSFKSLFKIFRYEAFLHSTNEVLLLGTHPLDSVVANQLNIENTNIIFSKKKFSIRKNDIKAIQIFLQCIVLFFRHGTLKLPILLKSLPGMIEYLLVTRDIDVHDIKLLIMESDSMPTDLALIFKAKENKIDTIKIDHFLIDPINHNRVFCDYYFYPSLLHYNIMHNFYENDKLNYVQGGIIHWDKLSEYRPLSTEKREITFFAQHGDLLTGQDELFYIEEILILMNENDHLNIKIHPHDKSKKFNHYAKHPNITLRNQIEDNYILIAQSDICFSICSTMSLEAKHLCEKSYFINYNISQFDGYIDYNSFNDTIETVTSSEILKVIMLSNKNTFPIATFIEKFNFSYPYSSEKLQILIKKILSEKDNL